MPEVVISIKAFDAASATLRQVSVETSTLKERAAALFRETQGGTRITAEHVSQIKELTRETRLQSELYHSLRRSATASFGVLNLVGDAFGRVASMGRMVSSVLNSLLTASIAQSTASKNLRDAQVDLAKAQEDVRIALEKLREAEEAGDVKAIEEARRELKAAYEAEEQALRRLREAQEEVNNVNIQTQAQILATAASALSAVPMMIALAGGVKMLTAALGPVGLALTAISVALPILAAAWEGNWGNIRGVAEAAGKAISDALGWVASGLSWLASEASKHLSGVVEAFKWVGEGISKVASFLQDVWGGYVKFWQTVWSMVLEVFQRFLSVLQSGLDWFKDVWSAAWRGIYAVGEWVWAKISAAAGFLADVWGKFIEFWQGVWNIIVDAVNAGGKVISNIASFIQGAWSKFVEFWQGVWKSIVDVLEGGKKVILDIASHLQNAWSRFIEFWRGVWKAFTEVFEAAVKAVSNAASWLTSILQPLFNLIQGILAALSSLAAQVGGAIGGALASIGVKIPGYQGLKEPITFRETTLAVLHEGETLLPKGYRILGGAGGTVNITLTLGPFYVQRLSEEEARRFSEMIFERLWRLTR